MRGLELLHAGAEFRDRGVDLQRAAARASSQ